MSGVHEHEFESKQFPRDKILEWRERQREIREAFNAGLLFWVKTIRSPYSDGARDSAWWRGVFAAINGFQAPLDGSDSK